MASVIDYLISSGITFDVLDHATVQTAMGEAFALGIAPEIVAKTIVLDVGPGHVVAAVPASRRLDMHLIREAIGAHDAHLATEDELRSEFPQYEPGTFPPLGSLIGAPLYLDLELVQHDEVVFAAGSRQQSIRVRMRDLLQLEHARVAPLTQAVDNDQPDGEFIH